MSYLSKVRESNPLVHNITNIVVANFSANGLLALGASPLWRMLTRKWSISPHFHLL